MNEIEIPTIADCLRYLEESGWTELIDRRWKEEVTNELKERFPNITEEVLEKTIKIVII